MWNAISPGFELVSPCPIPTTITITPRALYQNSKNDSNNEVYINWNFGYKNDYINIEYNK